MEETAHRKMLPVLAVDACCSPASPVMVTLAPARAIALAERLKALGDATRLRMLALLAQQSGPLCVCDITAQFALQQPTISHHLRILREAGFVDCEKRGIWAYYWVTADGRQSLALAETLR
jgi:ArsR family transcriptional regulator